MTYIDEIYKTISERLKSLREERGYTFSKVAEMCGIQQYQTVSNWENGNTRPSLECLLKLCKLYKCELGYILGEHNCKTLENSTFQNIAGLSDDAIDKLKNFNSMNKTEISNQVGKQYCDFFSCFITDLSITAILGKYIGKLIDAEKGKYNTELFNDQGEAKRYITFQIETGILDFLQHFVNQEVEEDN